MHAPRKVMRTRDRAERAKPMGECYLSGSNLKLLLWQVTLKFIYFSISEKSVEKSTLSISVSPLYSLQLLTSCVLFDRLKLE